MDRALDAQVAAAVFGLVPCQAINHQYNTYGLCYAMPDSPTQGGEVPLYSSDIGAAWTVVEAMRARGWWVTLSSPSGTAEPEGATWNCAFIPLGLCLPWHDVAEADTAPMAICKAALSALGVEVATNGN